MIKQITRSQALKLEHHLKAIKEDDEYEMTFMDNFLDLFIPARIGIIKNGLDVKEIMKAMGITDRDYKTVCTIRSSICNFVQSMLKEGYAFAGVKEKGKLKKYGWSTTEEFEQIEFDRKERCAKEISNTLHYLDDNNKLTFIGKSFLKEIDKQLELFNDKK